MNEDGSAPEKLGHIALGQGSGELDSFLQARIGDLTFQGAFEGTGSHQRALEGKRFPLESAARFHQDREPLVGPECGNAQDAGLKPGFG